MFPSQKTSRTRLSEPKNYGVAQQRADAPLHCGVLVEARYLAQAQPRGMARALAGGGHRVTIFDTPRALLDIEDSRWLAGLDLLVARGRSADLLARLSVAEAAGIPTLNRRQAIAAVTDKAHMATQLRAAGIPTPPTWIGAIEQVRQEIPRAAYPLILKPVYGDNCRGIRIVDTPHALDAVAWSEPCVIAQRLLPNNDFDIKLYAIGEHAWAVRKPSPLRGSAAAAIPLPLPVAWRNLARHCGELFGLQLFGVDCIETEGTLHVIEVNDFPNYTGVPEADFLLASHVAQHTQARRRA
jgi:glutathione synthase/RimK-type ligase-like ATP-grasp enzyme